MFQSILLSIPIINCKNSSLFLLVYSSPIHDSTSLFLLVYSSPIHDSSFIRKKSVKAKEPSAKKSKKERDPSKPKRPPTAFFLFMEDFRKTFKEANPDNKKVALVAKEGGEKWK
ncbi:putative chromatin remodeling & transcriptional activation HMG family [Helianthus annuus]|nr:putative chromatin remodeling & transcriptional activation HMG family [Helianthus annuus]